MYPVPSLKYFLTGGDCGTGRNLDVIIKQRQVLEQPEEPSVRFIRNSLGSFQSLLIPTLLMTITKQFISFSRNERKRKRMKHFHTDSKKMSNSRKGKKRNSKSTAA